MNSTALENPAASIPPNGKISRSKTFGKPTWGHACQIRVTVEAHRIGNQEPYFSVTAAIGTPAELNSGNWQAGGCLHEDAAKAWPEIKPLIDLHLSDAVTGAPIHAEANGFYWLAGICGGLGEKYHGGSGSDARDADKCLTIFAEHCRINLHTAGDIVAQVRRAFVEGCRTVATSEEVTARTRQEMDLAGRLAAHAAWKELCDAMRPRWEREALAGMELLQSL